MWYGPERVLWASGKTQSMNVDMFISVPVRVETSRSKISPWGSKITRARRLGHISCPPTGGNQKGKQPEGKRHFRKSCPEWPQEGKPSSCVTGREWRPGRILVGGGGCLRVSPGLKLLQVAKDGSRGCKLVSEGAWQAKEQKMDG